MSNDLDALALVVVLVLGVLAGALSPLLIARLPDRVADDGRRSYRDLAGMRALPVLLGVATAALWGVLAWARWGELDLPAYLWLAWVGVVAGYIDLREHRLPDVLNLAALVGVAGFLALASAIDEGWPPYGRAWLAALVATAVFLAMALARASGMGLGDVKLVGSLGLALGWLGWSWVAVGLFLGFLLAALVAVVLVVTRRADRHTALPFGPALLLGTLATVVVASV